MLHASFLDKCHRNQRMVNVVKDKFKKISFKYFLRFSLLIIIYQNTMIW